MPVYWMPAFAGMTAVAPPPSIRTHAGCPDRTGPFLDLTLDEFLQIFGRPAFGCDHAHDEFLEALLDRTIVDGGDRCGVKLLHDWVRRALGQENGEPHLGFETRKSLLLCGGKLRQDGRALLGEDGDRFDRLALDLRHRAAGRTLI